MNAMNVHIPANIEELMDALENASIQHGHGCGGDYLSWIAPNCECGVRRLHHAMIAAGLMKKPKGYVRIERATEKGKNVYLDDRGREVFE